MPRPINIVYSDGKKETLNGEVIVDHHRRILTVADWSSGHCVSNKIPFECMRRWS